MKKQLVPTSVAGTSFQFIQPCSWTCICEGYIHCFLLKAIPALLQRVQECHEETVIGIVMLLIADDGMKRSNAVFLTDPNRMDIWVSLHFFYDVQSLSLHAQHSAFLLQVGDDTIVVAFSL